MGETEMDRRGESDRRIAGERRHAKQPAAVPRMRFAAAMGVFMIRMSIVAVERAVGMDISWGAMIQRISDSVQIGKAVYCRGPVDESEGRGRCKNTERINGDKTDRRFDPKCFFQSGQHDISAAMSRPSRRT